MAFRINSSIMGCCGFNLSHQPRNPISLYGWVDTEEESKEFLSRCEEQVKFLHPEYKYGTPIYWSFKHPDAKRWYVSYQVLYNNDKVYKDSELKSKSLFWNAYADYFELKKEFKDTHPLDVYFPYISSAEDGLLSYIKNFDTRLQPFLDIEASIEKGRVVACTLYALAHGETQQIVDYIKTKKEVLFDVKWHNPYYSKAQATTLNDGDIHTLHTFFYRNT